MVFIKSHYFPYVWKRIGRPVGTHTHTYICVGGGEEKLQKFNGDEVSNKI